MAWTKVQDHVLASGTGTSGSLVYGSGGTGTNVTAGNLLVIMAFCNATGLTFPSISDTFSDTWSRMFTPISDGNVGQTICAWATIAQSGGSANTVAITYGGTVGANNGDMVMTEWSGGSGTLSQDGTAQDSGTLTGSASITHPTYTPTVTGDLVINMLATAAGITTISSPWTAGDHNSTMPNTAAGWGWLTGALSAVSSNASTGSASTDRSVIFGIEAAGVVAQLAASGFIPHRMPLGV